MPRESHYEDVARILGDTVTAIETHCSELGFTPSFRKASDPSSPLAQRYRQRMERLSQNGWIGSEKSSDSKSPQGRSTLHTDSRLVADVPVSIIKPFV